MNLTTLGKYLLGNGEAILKIAASRNAVWLGLLFVISAGFAREYDGEYLLAEPWHLALPLGASLGTSIVLFSLLWLIARGGSRAGVSFFGGYRSFLGLYWMTAPLAWLYAIPVERFLSAPDSVRANLYLLGLVSLWRVFLMIRVAMVLFGARFAGALGAVMLFADSVALVLLYLTPLPVFSIMGGIRLSDSEQVVQGTAFMVGFLALVTLPVWLMLSGAALGMSRWEPRFPPTSGSEPIIFGNWGLAVLALLIWIPILPFTQQEQRLRFEAERLLRSGRVSEAIAYLSRHEPSNFPPHWDPPPRVGYGERTPPVIDLLVAVEANATKPWVRDMVHEKLRAEAGYDFVSMAFWRQLDDDDLERVLSVIERLPADDPFVLEQEHALLAQTDENSDRAPELQQRIRRLFPPTAAASVPGALMPQSTVLEMPTTDDE